MAQNCTYKSPQQSNLNGTKYKHVKGQLGPLLDRWNLEISKNPKANGSFLFRAATKDPCDIKSIDLISVEIIIEYVE